MSPYAALRSLAVVFLAAFQAPLPSPPAVSRRSPELPPLTIEDQYGPLQVVDLESLAHSGRTYHRRLVQVRGVVGDLVPGQYLDLSQGAVSVMLIPLEEGNFSDYASLVGTDVDVTGVARVLPVAQIKISCRGTKVPASKCEDWELPALPDAQPGWPALSITVTKMMDRGTGPGEGRRRPQAPKGGGLFGQFRGANLCGDLPMVTRRDSEDWVLLTPEGPVWVTGRRPAGRGFALDPGSRGDTSRWLAVSGKVEMGQGVRYLKARRVEMISRPEDSLSAPCPP